MISNLVLSSEQVRQLEAACDRFRVASRAVEVHLIDRHGMPISVLSGGPQVLNVDAVASLAASNFATSVALAQLVDETSFGLQVLQGADVGMVLAPLGRRLLIVACFDEKSSSGLVQWALDQLHRQISPLIRDLDGDSALKSTPPLLKQSVEN